MRTNYALKGFKGLVRSGQNDFIWEPGQQAKSNAHYPVLAVHGSGQQNGFAYVPNFGSVSLIANLCLKNGSTVMASENDDQAWGNNQALTDLDGQLAYLANTYGTPQKVILVGGSMGGYTSLRYAMTRPNNVAAVVAIIPLTDIKWFYNYWGNSGASPTAAQQIATAWGLAAPLPVADTTFTATSTAVTSASNAFTSAMNGCIVYSPGYSPLGTTFTYVDAGHGTLSVGATTTGVNASYTTSMLAPLPTAADIQSVANTLTVPTKIYFSGTDALVNPTQQQAFAANANANVGIPAINVGTNGHSEQTILDSQNYNGVRAADIIAFITQHGG